MQLVVACKTQAQSQTTKRTAQARHHARRTCSAVSSVAPGACHKHCAILGAQPRWDSGLRVRARRTCRAISSVAPGAMAGSDVRVAATHVYSAPLGGPAARPGLAPGPWPGLAPGPWPGLAAGAGAPGTDAASAAAETRHAAAKFIHAFAQHASPGCLVVCGLHMAI